MGGLGNPGSEGYAGNLGEQNAAVVVSGVRVSGPAEAETSAPSTDNLGTTARLVGAVRRPRRTFEAVAEWPRSAGLLALLFAVYFLGSAALFSTQVGRLALVDQWESTATAFGRPVDDALYAEFRRLSEQGVPYAAVTALARGPAAAILLATVLFGWFTGIRGGRGSYSQVLAVVATSAVVLMLRHLVATPVSYLRETTGSPASLAQLMTMVDQASPVARFFSLIDLFVLWWLVVLAIGIAVLYGRRTRELAILFVGVYAGVALLLSGVMAALGGV
jgi:hypothetical protein